MEDQSKGQYTKHVQDTDSQELHTITALSNANVRF